MTVGLQTSLTSETDSVATDTTANLQSKRDAIIQEFNKSENRIRRSFRSRLSDFIAETYESKNLTNIFDCRKLEEQILTNIKERKEKFQLLRQKSRVNKEREVRLREDLARVQIALKKHLLPEISNEGNVYETIDGQKVSQSEALKLYQDRLRKAKLEIKNLEVSTEELQARLDRVVELRRANGNSEGEATNYASLFHSEGNTDFGLVSPEKDEMRADFLRKMAEMQAQLDKDLSREREKTKMELEVSAARFDSLRKKARHSQAAVNLPKTSQLRQKLFDKPTSCMSVGIECNLDSA